MVMNAQNTMAQAQNLCFFIETIPHQNRSYAPRPAMLLALSSTSLLLMVASKSCLTLTIQNSSTTLTFTRAIRRNYTPWAIFETNLNMLLRRLEKTATTENMLR